MDTVLDFRPRAPLEFREFVGVHQTRTVWFGRMALRIDHVAVRYWMGAFAKHSIGHDVQADLLQHLALGCIQGLSLGSIAPEGNCQERAPSLIRRRTRSVRAPEVTSATAMLGLGSASLTWTPGGP